MCGTFRRISQLWDNAHTLNLENCLLYLLSTISQFLTFIDFIFYCVTAHTLYIIVFYLTIEICPRSLEGKYASFKNIKFPRSNYQTDSSETKTLYSVLSSLFTTKFSCLPVQKSLNTTLSCDQFKPTRIREDLLVNK